MAWRKSPPELIAAFDAALPDDRRVQRRSMFGYPCAFARGNMFTGLHQESLIVRLPERDRARLLARPGASIFAPMPGRQMKEYVAVPPELIEDGEELREWMALALDYAASLPVKAPKGAGTRAPAAAARVGAKGTAKGTAKGKATATATATAKAKATATATAGARARGR